jgi:putative toxin-antitoxin system antitoxin component (TIGR02293 family)
MAHIAFGHVLSALNLNADDVPSEVALAAKVARGLPVGSVEHLISLGVPQAEIYNFIPRRTLQRRKTTGAMLTPEESERIERLAAIFTLAVRVFGDSGRAMHWLLRPNRHFRSRRPIDLIHSHTGTRVVEERLIQGYFGNVG